MGLVEEVEELRAELDGEALGDPGGLAQREIGDVRARTDDGIAPGVAECNARILQNGSLRVTPAMAAGGTDHVWSIDGLLKAGL